MLVRAGDAGALGPDTRHCSEPALAVTPYSAGSPANIVVGYNFGWVDASGAFNPDVVEFAHSLDGGNTFAVQQPPAVACGVGMADPVVAASALSGDLWVGYGRAGCVAIFRKPFGSPIDLTPNTVVDEPVYTDKPFLAIGPQPQGFNPPPTTPETMYAGYRLTSELRVIKSSDSTPAGGQWQLPPHPVFSGPGFSARTGTGAYPEVIAGGDFVGRLLYASCYAMNSLPPEMTYHDKGGDPSQGVNWATAMPLDHFGVGGSQQIFGLGNPIPIPAGIRAFNLPSVAIDPSNPADVYVIFVGRTSPDSTNLDLFLARSFNYGTDFFPENTIHLTDNQFRVLGDNPALESDEWCPAVAIDDYGGINIIFTWTNKPDSTAPADTYVSQRYARFPNDASLTGIPYVKNLTPNAAGGFNPWFPGQAGYEYHMVKAAGCYVYLVYAAKLAFIIGDPGPDPILPTWNIYFRKVLVGPCRADFNMSGMIDGEDFGLFYDAYTAGDPAADMNGDEFIEGADEDSYIEAYCEGCPTPA